MDVNRAGHVSFVVSFPGADVDDREPLLLPLDHFVQFVGTHASERHGIKSFRVGKFFVAF